MSRGIFVALLAATAILGQSPSSPPAAKRVDFREVFHGVELTDPYHWLEDFDQPEARAWIEAQDQHARSYLAALRAQDSLRKQYAALMKLGRLSMPRIAGGRYFYTRTLPDRAQPLLCLRRSADGPEEVWLDPASLSSDSSVAAQLGAVSKDGKLANYAIRRSGQDEIELRIRDIDAGKDLPDRLPKALYNGFAFRNDRSGIYYARRSREAGSRIFFHQLGSDPSSDREIFGKGLDARVVLSPQVTADGGWLVIHARYGWARGEVYYKDLRKDGAVRPLTAGIEAQFTAYEAGPGKMLLETTWNAPRTRLLLVDLERPERENWRDVIPEAADTLSVSVAGGRIYAHYIHNVQTQIKVFSLQGKPLGELAVPRAGNAFVQGRWEQDEGFIATTSFTAPLRIERFEPRTGERKIWFEQKIPARSEDLEVEQVWYASRDGTRVPMFLAHRKGLKRDGNRPALLTGYGGFNVPLLPGFNADAVVWASFGGVWAQPSLRGGGEFGEDWHRAGMLDKKQNVFDDFIAAAEWLIANGYTKPARLAISGTSNGGLLVGAALTQRPDLFRAVLCGYPDLDMVRYYRYTRNNNPPALLEYGDGSNPRHFPFLRSWSPYERVKEGAKYPAVLLTTGEGDTRVPPQQAVKMAAKLQWATRSGLPVLLRFDRKSGHAGGRGLDERIADLASERAFLLQQLGVQ